jgi:hypothetical protein
MYHAEWKTRNTIHISVGRFEAESRLTTDCSCRNNNAYGNEVDGNELSRSRITGGQTSVSAYYVRTEQIVSRTIVDREEQIQGEIILWAWGTRERQTISSYLCLALLAFSETISQTW